jgi:hypothetical protein
MPIPIPFHNQYQFIVTKAQELKYTNALHAGIMADYPMADAWFGTKAMIRLTQETSLVPVLRMKKNNMKYRLSEFIRAKTASKNELRKISNQILTFYLKIMISYQRFS